jgi:hypothetical protein
MGVHENVWEFKGEEEMIDEFSKPNRCCLPTQKKNNK